MKHRKPFSLAQEYLRKWEELHIQTQEKITELRRKMVAEMKTMDDESSFKFQQAKSKYLERERVLRESIELLVERKEKLISDENKKVEELELKEKPSKELENLKPKLSSVSRSNVNVFETTQEEKETLPPIKPKTIPSLQSQDLGKENKPGTSLSSSVNQTTNAIAPLSAPPINTSHTFVQSHKPIDIPTSTPPESDSSISTLDVKPAGLARSVYGDLCYGYISEYKNFQTFLQSQKTAIESTPSSRKLELKMQIHKRIGQASMSLSQISLISNDLIQLLKGVKSTSMTAYSYSTDLMTLKLIEQGESQVSLFLPSAYFIGLMIVKIAAKDPDFMKIFIGRLLESCCFVLGPIPSAQPGETKGAYIKRLGYKQKGNHGFETSENWSERMIGLLALYAAILTSNTENGELFDPKMAWLWLAEILNSNQPFSLTPLLLITFLEMAGYGLYITYKGQFIKALLYIRDVYLPFLNSLKNKIKFHIQGLTRLELYLKDILEVQRGVIKEPEGRRIV